MRRLKLTLEYDGANYVGMQYQPNGVSIQEVVEATLYKICNEKISIVASGRTDAGVHALCQPVHLDFPIDSMNPQSLQKALNSLLPANIRVDGVEIVPDDFHARYHAKKRTYRYNLTNQLTAFNHNYFAYLYFEKLDCGLINSYLELLHGEHDFTNFCKANPEITNHNCYIFSANIWRDENSYFWEISGNRFLHNMIRRIVGACFILHQERAEPEKILQILNGNETSAKYKFCAPANGLYLFKVDY